MGDYRMAKISKTSLEEQLQELKIREEMYRIALEQSKATVWSYDIATRTITQTELSSAQYDFPETIDNIPESLIESGHIHPDSADVYRDMFRRIHAGEAVVSAMYMLRVKSGQYQWKRVTYHTIFDEKQKPIRAIAVAESISIQEQLAERYHRELLFRDESSPDLFASYKVNLSNNLVENYKIEKTQTGEIIDVQTYEEWLEEAGSRIISTEDKMRMMRKLDYPNLMNSFKQGIKELSVEYRRKSANDEINWVDTTINLMKEPHSGDMVGFIYVRNIDEKKKTELKLQKQAKYDAITGLYNKDTVEKEIGERIGPKCAPNARCALLLIDIDDFKNVNDIIGRQAGDKVLGDLADAMRLCFTTTTLMGRIGGDEFVVFLEDIVSEDWVHNQVKKLSDILHLAYLESDKIINTSGSIGITIAMSKEANYCQLFEQADSAMCEAKRMGKNGYSIFDPKGKKEKGQADATEEEVEALLSGVTANDEEYALRERIEYLCYHDEDTGLLNRNSYTEYIKEMEKEMPETMGVVIGNINGLKEYNQELGLSYGDRILKDVANVMEEYFKKGMIYRYSGDEYRVLSPDISYEQFIEQIELVNVAFEGIAPNVISKGYVWEKKPFDLAEMMLQADELMQLEKNKYYQMAGDIHMHHQPVIMQGLLKTIEEEQFGVYLQPKADIATGEIVGAEAFVRLESQTRGVVAPEKYISLLEKANLIHYVDLHVYEKVCRILRNWKDQGKKLLPISINLSVVTLLQEDLIPRMVAIQQQYEIPNEYLEIEISETLKEVNQDVITEISNRIRAENFRIALDDFGSKESSLSILSSIHVDVLKLDESIIHDIGINEKNQIIAQSIIDICKNLHIQSVAEGVETEAQLHILEKMGCQLAQGFLFNQAVPVPVFEKRYIVDSIG